ncbi:scavenger receptor class B member 1-like [Maniola jurtina]|uniref:scavenger receptor class B member 1-like n=1 Tax=Maniola jurtina TaxID=191418 RepID=UPI001E68FB5A|nr:scavenger receptor class B member 1-like [Maniola jurtina]
MRPKSALVFVQILLFTALAASKNHCEDDLMVLKKNSFAYSKWQRPMERRLMKVYLFNYTNWERVRDGLDTKFDIEEVGPYVYSQQLERVNVTWEGDLLTYQEHSNFTFLPEASAGAHSDKVFVPNVPLLDVSSNVANSNYFTQVAMRLLLSMVANDTETFLQLTVERFLWGYEDELVKTIKPFLDIKGYNFTNFGLLVTKNGTSSNILTINTGENDINKINTIEKLNGHKALSFWDNPECNSIESSDGSAFPPLSLDKNQTLKVFSSGLCRRLPFKYAKDVEMGDGVKLLRYELARDVFDDPAHNPDNQCYCNIDTGDCPPRGVFNVTHCSTSRFLTEGPAVASFPHFHLGDPALRERFTGLHPDSEQHQSYLDIHPTLGIAVRGKSTLQLNIQVKKLENFGPVQYFPQGLILPVAWIEMSVEELPENLQTLENLNKLLTEKMSWPFSIVAH